MSELPVNKQKLIFFIHSESPHNKLNYVYNQAKAENEVIYTFSIKNALLLSIANKPTGNYVEIINNLIPDGVIKIKEDSKQISEQIRVLCWKINEKTEKLRRSERNDFLEEFSKLSILVSDVLTAWEYEQDKKRMEKKAVELNESMENWKKKYENLEEEKRALFEEMMEQNSKEKKTLENDKEKMRNYIQQLEKSSELPHNIKNFTNLSQRQQKRRRKL